MKIKYLAFVAAVVVLLGTGIAEAETLLSIDFDNYTSSPTTPYTVGNVIGQDNWERTASDTNRDSYVGNGVDINTTQIYYGSPDPVVGTARATRPHYISFTSADTNVEFSLWGYLECDTVNNYIGNLAISPMWEQTKSPHAFARGDFGMYYKSSYKDHPQVWFRDGNGYGSFGDTLISGHWYEIKAVIDFSTLCGDGTTYGSVTMEYRDLTNGEEDFTIDSEIQDKDLYLVPDINGKFNSLGIVATLQPSPYSYNQHQYIDNISIVNPVPEPSTLALFASGLIGLLAYAWRKRK